MLVEDEIHSWFYLLAIRIRSFSNSFFIKAKFVITHKSTHILFYVFLYYISLL